MAELNKYLERNKNEIGENVYHVTLRIPMYGEQLAILKVIEKETGALLSKFFLSNVGATELGCSLP
jgi:hypothetical protein